MEIFLSPELEKRVAEEVASGRYADASEVVRESLRLLLAVEGAGEGAGERRARLQAEIQVGLDELDRGEGVEGEASRRRMLSRFGAGA